MSGSQRKGQFRLVKNCKPFRGPVPLIPSDHFDAKENCT